ncbi:MAG: hypothetical protein CBB68_06815 [Rhodospirillaceae bacterium TMED8]|nr:hypothetical protein [Magnetovibrio sp.]MAH85447.1 hypothetical protein [Magnetovibrio sp.]OUT47951.1 MAG: hypothetical protein CBB68_14580 [Rhodospirillaceae bacterium TMED8]OUT51327.1 MAG: hypothetical protein CBB68_06815 [Rhodospirillaceae bacterium TMED8]|tara:strand:- start:1725 stop:2543 length:819 start_codon:yes stop_codon:yes gene_type:complete
MNKIIKDNLKKLVSSITGTATNGPKWMRKAAAFSLSSIDDRRQILTPHGKIIVHVGSPIERWRADTLLTKEPETTAWLERTIAPDSVIYDVGANIGLYALYAAHLFPKSVRAVCFEPEPINFARLNQNILANDFTEQFTAYPIGLGALSRLDRLPLSSLQGGSALHGPRMIEAGEAAHVVGINVWMLDEFCQQSTHLPNPTHLKIDVDGPEFDIVRGAASTLREPSLRHVLIEVTMDERTKVENLFQTAGFFAVSSGKKHDGMFNLIFQKNA